MQNRKIKNSQLSSYTSDSGWTVDKGRLHNSRSWCSHSNDVGKEYFQIDLLRVRHVSAIATQGVKHFLRDYYVETYMIKYSYDGRLWLFYELENGADVVSDTEYYLKLAMEQWNLDLTMKSPETSQICSSNRGFIIIYRGSFLYILLSLGQRIPFIIWRFLLSTYQWFAPCWEGGGGNPRGI